MRSTIGLFLLRHRWMIGSFILVGVVAYLLGGWGALLVIPLSMAVAIGVMFLFGWL